MFSSISVFVVVVVVFFLQMKTQQKVTRYTEKHDPKKQNKSPEVDSKEMEIYEPPNKEFKVIVLNKLNVLQKNTDNK